MFDDSPDEKSLNLEKETGEENRMRDKTPRLKTSQTRKKRREENQGVKG